jgi:tetratricopeptide (TPR) repeat protein
MNRISVNRFALLAGAALAANAPMCGGQMMPGGQGGMGGMGRPGVTQPGEDTPTAPAADKPDAASRKAYAAGMKSLTKAKDYESAAATATNAGKKASDLEKMVDNYNRALDEFTDALSNKGDMVEAWNNVGYIHLHLGAYAESVDDYNHTLALEPELPEAVLHRAEAYLGVDRLQDAQAAYMDLFNHARPLADELLLGMQRWLSDHRSNANGMRAADIEAFDKWLQERDSIAKQTASLP